MPPIACPSKTNSASVPTAGFHISSLIVPTATACWLSTCTDLTPKTLYWGCFWCWGTRSGLETSWHCPPTSSCNLPWAWRSFVGGSWTPIAGQSSWWADLMWIGRIPAACCWGFSKEIGCFDCRWRGLFWGPRCLSEWTFAVPWVVEWVARSGRPFGSFRWISAHCWRENFGGTVRSLWTKRERRFGLPNPWFSDSKWELAPSWPATASLGFGECRFHFWTSECPLGRCWGERCWFSVPPPFFARFGWATYTNPAGIEASKSARFFVANSGKFRECFDCPFSVPPLSFPRKPLGTDTSRFWTWSWRLRSPSNPCTGRTLFECCSAESDSRWISVKSRSCFQGPFGTTQFGSAGSAVGRFSSSGPPNWFGRGWGGFWAHRSSPLTASIQFLRFGGFGSFGL